MTLHEEHNETVNADPIGEQHVLTTFIVWQCVDESIDGEPNHTANYEEFYLTQQSLTPGSFAPIQVYLPILRNVPSPEHPIEPLNTMDHQHHFIKDF
jgi:hypothetical protein